MQTKKPCVSVFKEKPRLGQLFVIKEASELLYKHGLLGSPQFGIPNEQSNSKSPWYLL